MTMDVAMGLVSGASARGGERGGKGAQAGTTGFDDALAAKPAGRMPQGRRDEEAVPPPAQWMLGYGDRLVIAMPGAPAGPAAGDTSDAAPLPLLPQPDEMADVDAATEEDAPSMAVDAGQTAQAALTAPTQKEAQPKQDAGSPAASPGDDEDASAPRAAAPDDAAGTGKRRGQIAPSIAGGQSPTPAPATAAADRQPPRAEAAAGRTPANVAAQPDASTQQAQRPAPTAQQPVTFTMAADKPAASVQPADATQPRVNVLGFSTSAPPPAMPVQFAMPAQLSTTAAGLVATIEAEPTWRAAAAEAAVSQRGPAPGSVSTLRIQLNPAELGMVTARLTATGSQLEIEIRVESNDARQKLANDSDAILKALRGIGYDIDKVTIQQQAQQGGNAGQQQGASGRDAFLQGQEQEKAGTNAGGRDGQGSGNGTKAGHPDSGEMAAERPGGGVYI